MTDVPHKPEEQPLKRIEEQQQAELQRELERKVVEAKPASGDIAFKPEPASENEKLKLTTGDRTFPQKVEAEHQVNHALSPDDPAAMTFDTARLKPETRQALQEQKLWAQPLDGDQAEAYARTVIEREGVPDGQGGVEKLRRVVPGQYVGKLGIDLVGATESGDPTVIEIKKREVVSWANLDGKVKTENLEPEIQRWLQERGRELTLYKAGRGLEVRPDANETFRPEVQAWRRDMERQLDLAKEEDRIGPDGQVRLDVKQMDEYWVKDRWLKLLRSSGGSERLQTAGVHPRYCRPENFSGDDSSLWKPILERRISVIVSPSDELASRTMLRQAVLERRSRAVMLIKY